MVGWSEFKYIDMYKVGRIAKSTMTSVEVFEGETIEQKIERVVSNDEPITDGAATIFTERKDGVISAYNIRTDRWEIATDAMDAVSKSHQAKRENKALEAQKAMKVVKDGEASHSTATSSDKGASEG